MLTYIKLKNFMSFKEVIFDFRSGRKGAKKFVSVYGENGSGKSNFVNSIDLLRRSIDSFHMIGNEEKMNELLAENKLPQELYDMILENTNILRNAENCRMLECEEETGIEYGFEYNNHEGYYCMSFRERFIYEKLYYYSGKQSGELFEIKFENGKVDASFSNKLFLNRKVELEFTDEINKFWGKHTCLSILNKEREEKNEQYVKENYLGYIFDILDMLEEITLHCKKTSHSGSQVSARKPDNLLRDLDKGKIKIKNEAILERSEKIVRDFFTQTYADIKDMFYERKIEKDDIIYKLFVRKMIGGKIRTIDFSRESAGTQHILEIIHSLLGAFCGMTVIYDEIDDGIHDILLKNVLTSMIDEITGQLIITTHNTYMLETIDIKSVYLINVDYQGNKKVKCLDKYPRIQGTNNPRNMYLKGLFGGVPIVDIIDYDGILGELRNDTREEGGK